MKHKHIHKHKTSALNQVSTSLGNSGLCWTVFARNKDTAVPAEGNGDLQTLICVLVARPRQCLTLSNPVPWQNWMAAYLGYTLWMKTLFRGWPVMAHDMHTRKRIKESVNITIIIVIKYSLLTLPPIMIVRGTNGMLGFFFSRLYSVMMCRMFNSWRLYSWILLTWMSNIDAGSTTTPYCFSINDANFILFSYINQSTNVARHSKPHPMPHGRVGINPGQV